MRREETHGVGWMRRNGKYWKDGGGEAVILQQISFLVATWQTALCLASCFLSPFYILHRPRTANSFPIFNIVDSVVDHAQTTMSLHAHMCTESAAMCVAVLRSRRRHHRRHCSHYRLGKQRKLILPPLEIPSFHPCLTGGECCGDEHSSCHLVPATEGAHPTHHVNNLQDCCLDGPVVVQSSSNYARPPHWTLAGRGHPPGKDWKGRTIASLS